MRVIAQEPHGAYIANPRVSPDGKRIVATRFDGQRFRIALIDARDGRAAGDAAHGRRSGPRRLVGGRPPRRVPRGRRRGRRLPGATTTTSTAARIGAAYARAVPRVPAQRRRRAHVAVPEPRGLALDARRDSAAPRAPPPRPAPAWPPRRADPADASRPTITVVEPAGAPAAARRRPAAASRNSRGSSAGACAPARAGRRRSRRPPAAAVATNLIPPDFPTSRRARPITCSSRSSTDRPSRAGRAGHLPGRRAVGRRPARMPPLGARRLLPARGGRRRRLVRLLEPAARAADAVAGAAQFRSRTSRRS